MKIEVTQDKAVLSVEDLQLAVKEYIARQGRVVDGKVCIVQYPNSIVPGAETYSAWALLHPAPLPDESKP